MISKLSLFSKVFHEQVPVNMAEYSSTDDIIMVSYDFWWCHVIFDDIIWPLTSDDHIRLLVLIYYDVFWPWPPGDVISGPKYS